MRVHTNQPLCPGCQKKMDEHPSFNPELKAWFNALQLAVPDAHISCAWRGRVDQEALFKRGATKARFPQSPHNWGCAIDIFRNCSGDIFDKKWFEEVVAPHITDNILWYGKPGSPFYELPHFEIKDWDQKLRGTRVLVE